MLSAIDDFLEGQKERDSHINSHTALNYLRDLALLAAADEF